MRRRRPTSNAWNYLARLLKVRPRSEYEARTRLEAKGYAPAEIDRAMSLAIEAGLLDDRAFASLWVTDRVEHRPLARSAVARELQEMGVPPDLAQEAMAKNYPPELERDLMWRLARERFDRLGSVTLEKRERRTIGYLTRRGFLFSASRCIVSRLAKEATREAKEVDDG